MAMGGVCLASHMLSTLRGHETNGRTLMGMSFLLIYYITMNTGSTNFTSSFITDVKITKNHQRNTYPFAYTYKTGSTIWTNWYDGMYSSACTYDDANIHSLQNNLPQRHHQIPHQNF